VHVFDPSVGGLGEYYGALDFFDQVPLGTIFNGSKSARAVRAYIAYVD